MNCLYCAKETTNPKFCNRSCSASYTNKTHPRRTKMPRYCKYCNSKLSGRRSVACKSCNPNRKDWTTISLGDTQGKAKYQISARIRNQARSVFNSSDKPKKCLRCGYDKHYEVAHIQSINSFSPETAISTINSLENLMALCRNCHWEFDNDFWFL